MPFSFNIEVHARIRVRLLRLVRFRLRAVARWVKESQGVRWESADPADTVQKEKRSAVHQALAPNEPQTGACVVVGVSDAALGGEASEAHRRNSLEKQRAAHNAPLPTPKCKRFALCREGCARNRHQSSGRHDWRP